MSVVGEQVVADRSEAKRSPSRARFLIVRRLLPANVVVAVLVLTSWVLESWLSSVNVALVLALLSAGSGAAAALLAVFAAQLTADQQVGWVSMALGCHALLAIPTLTLANLDSTPAAVAVHLLADALVAGLLLTACFAPPRLTRRRVGAVVLSAAAAVVGTIALAQALPATVDPVVSSVLPPLALTLLWTASGVTIAARGTGQQARGVRMLGVGVALLGSARVLRITVPDWPLVVATSTAARMAAVALILYGALLLARQALTRFEDAHDTLEEELRQAEIQMARTVRRDHELRNGLAGLAGATTLLSASCSDRARLATVVASELDRLDDLLQAAVDAPPAAPTTTYAVAPVLHGLVTLRRAAGMDVQLDVDPGLTAVGSSAALAQVVTNLLGNADRHAPGSPVRISALMREDRIVVHVHDSGPGVPPGAEEAVFEPGVHDRLRGGRGLGLHMCRRLLSNENGSIIVLPVDPEATGCTVVVEIPAAPATPRLARPFVPPRLQSTS